MNLQHSKHAIIVIDLEIGETVLSKVEKKDKQYVIKDIILSKNCESGILVKLEKLDRYIDSHWIEKVKP